VKYVVADFETASRVDLKKIGAWKYAADMSTFPLCLGIKVVTDGKPAATRVLSEKQLHALDPELMALAADPEVIFVAHNAGFEQGMWTFHMVPMGYPPLPPERWHDTMAVAGMKALPLGLDALVTALELPVKKDMDGHRHMLIMCKPDRLDGWSHHNDFNHQRNYDYCGEDVNAQYGVYLATQGLGASERHTWVLDQKINQRGIKIDTEFVHACMDVLEQVRTPMVERFREMTGLNPTQREKVLNWVNDQGVPLGDMKKATLDAILDPDDEFGIEDFGEPLPYHVHEVLTLRRSLASSSVAKLQRMLDCAGGDGRVRYATQYHGARTGRDAGRLIQIQNYPRGEIGDRQGLTADILADAILTRNVSYIQELWGPDIFSAVISSLRSCIIPEKGKVLVGGDFAAVEARNLLSMAGQHDRVDQMHAGLDVYSETASMIFRKPVNRKDPAQAKEGQIGKNTVLGSGYGLGPVGFRARFAPKDSIDLAMLAINTYRKEFAPMVPKFWYGLWEASVQAVYCDHAKTYSYEGIEFRKESDFLTMRLPSGRKLWYHRPRKAISYTPQGEERPSWTFMSYQGKKFRRHLAWHGMLTADCIQGSARDLMVEAMKRAEAAGLTVIFKVHDELVCEEFDRPDVCETLKQVMEDISPWAIERKFRVKAEVDKMVRYRK
jgi:DNA polymerase bacteriophage-type